MSDLTKLQTCGRCGSSLSGYGPEGLCAACLLESAFGEPGARPGEDRRPAPALVLRDYEVLEEIARGGMGVVYRARQISLNRIVALKMVLGGPLANAAEMQRFRAEAETAARLQHPNIVAIHEIGELAGQPFFSMDLVAGRDLAQLVRDGPLPARKAAAYLKTIAEAVQYAHSRGVLHRDLKPSNILIDDSDQLRVTDFGLAKRLSDTQPSTNDPQLTQTGQVLGSPSFIPPEQAAGRKSEIGPASDVYSLGAILYQCLTGRPPFVADTLPQTLRMVAEQEPVSPRLLNASVPPDLETICLKCLEKDPVRRYATAQALADDLGRFLHGEPIHARPVSPALKVHRWCLRNKALAMSGTAALALLLVVAVGSPIALIRIDRERRQAKTNAQKAQTEAVRSQQVAKFFKAMLRSAGPSVARGRDATILREILDGTSERAGKDLMDQPEVQADIYSTIGATFVDIGDHRRAITNFEQAARSYRLAFPGDHRNLAYTLNALGFCQSFTGDVARGSNNAWLGMEMARRCGDQEILFTGLLNYAGALRAWGMVPPEAEPYLREALVLKQKMGNDPVAVATAMDMLSGSLTNAEEEERLLRDALGIFRKHLPLEHPRTVQGAFSLGQNLVGAGKLEEAERVLREAVQGFHKTHDPNHPYQPIVLRFLVEALLGQKKGEEAESLVRQQAMATPEVVGYQDLLRRVVAFRSTWALNDEVLKDLKGDFLGWDLDAMVANVGLAKVERSYRTLLQKQREQHGPDSPKLAGPLLQLAEICAKQGELSEAESLGHELLELRRKGLGTGHPETVNALFYLASLFIRDNKLTEAEALYREMAEANPGSAGHYYGRAGHWKEAAAAFERNIRSEPDNPQNYRLLAPILLFSEDVEGYRNICRQMVTRFAGTLDAVVADSIARACLISPDSGVDLIVVAGLADAAVSLGKQHDDLPWFEVSKALADYRQEHFADAASWAQQALRRAPYLEPEATAYVVLAMAQWRSRQYEVARLTLSRASEIVDQKLPNPEGGDDHDWADVIGVHLLIREARAFINDDQRQGPDLAKSAVMKSPGEMEARANTLARGGRWQEAAAEIVKAIEIRPTNHLYFHMLLPLLVANGDLAAYRQRCQLAVARLGGTTDPGTADRMAKDCLILPDSGVDMKAVRAWAATAVGGASAPEGDAWHHSVRGLAEYRQGNFAQAAEWLGKVPIDGTQPERDAQVLALQAMTQQHLQNISGARAFLAKAAAIMDVKLPQMQSGNVGPDWIDWIIAQTFWREAKTVLGETVDSKN